MADQQFSISLPEEAIRSMQARVDAGEYASLRDLILDSIETSDLTPLDPEYFGEDFKTYLANNREQILRESEDWESMIPAEEVIAKLRRKRTAEVSASAV